MAFARRIDNKGALVAVVSGHEVLIEQEPDNYQVSKGTYHQDDPTSKYSVEKLRAITGH